MKIEIQNNDFSGVYGYNIYDLNNRKLIHNYNNHFISQRYFDDEDVLKLLSPNQYAQFEQGKYEFDVSKKQIFAVSNDINYFTQPK